MFCGNDACFDVFSGACPLSPGSSNTKFVLGGIEMSCGPNTVFSQAACACVHLPGGKLLVCTTWKTVAVITKNQYSVKRIFFIGI